MTDATLEINRDAIIVTRPSAHVAVVRIASKPLGVLGVAIRRGLLSSLRELDADRWVRAVILTGTGGTFSVGSNIKEFQRDPGWLLAAEQAENGVNDFIERMRAPVIAAINGHALGGGFVMALACDIRICARTATVGLPETKVGAFASGSGTQRLPRLIGRGRALLLLLTGRILPADEAHAMGLVEQVVEAGDLEVAALSLAQEIAAVPPEAVEASKACVNEGLREGWARGMLAEAAYVVSTGLSDAALEGQRAFLEKRRPNF